MGGNKSKANKLEFEAKDWDEVEKCDFHEVVRNKLTGQEGNRYHFNIQSERKLAEEVDIYYRRQSSSNWVQVIGAKVEKGGFGFCGSQDSANVITERIPFTLHQVGRLNQEESNVVLYNALRGFNDVSKLVVPTNINDQMIAFNPAGQTKVWVNENFGMNYPRHYNPEFDLNESDLVNNLINAVEPHTELPQGYANGLRQSGNINSALNYIKSSSGVPLNILESNRIDVSRHGHGQVHILRDNAPVMQSEIHHDSHPPVHFTHQQPIYQHQPQYSSVIQQQAPVGYHQTGYVNSNVHFTHNPAQGSNLYQQPGQYIPNQGQSQVYA